MMIKIKDISLINSKVKKMLSVFNTASHNYRNTLLTTVFIYLSDNHIQYSHNPKCNPI